MRDTPRIVDARAFDAAGLAAAKGPTRVSVCLPARNEAATIGTIVEIVHGLVQAGLVDELIVMDDGSRDGTGDVAAAAGAKVVTTTQETLMFLELTDAQRRHRAEQHPEQEAAGDRRRGHVPEPHRPQLDPPLPQPQAHRREHGQHHHGHLADPGRYILETTTLAEEDKPDLRQYSVAVRVSLNVANLRNFFGQFAPELRTTQYGPEIWSTSIPPTASPTATLTAVVVFPTPLTPTKSHTLGLSASPGTRCSVLSAPSRREIISVCRASSSAVGFATMQTSAPFACASSISFV